MQKDGSESGIHLEPSDDSLFKWTATIRERPPLSPLLPPASLDDAPAYHRDCRGLPPGPRRRSCRNAL